MSQRDCSSCKKKYDIASFEENGRNFKMCLKCREKSRRKDLARRNDPKRIEYKQNKSKEKKYYQTYRDKKREEDNDAFVEHNTHRQRITHSFRVSALRHSAKGSGIEVQLTDEEMYRMMEIPCFYCGCVDLEKTLNGIDRLDSSDNYAVENCVPCCSTCNFMKKCLDPITFVKRCSHIVTKTVADDDVWKNYKGTPLSTYKSRAEQKNLEFTLTEDEFNILREGNCHYCERSHTATMHINGIDRLDSSIGYTSSNCVSCCGDCNYAKGVFDQDVFLQKCELIHKHNKVSSLTIEIPKNINMMKRI
jgi:hypothetical protein